MQHKLLNKLLILTLLAWGGVIINPAWAQADNSTNYTGNVTLSTTGGTSASACKVKIGGTDYNGIKAGTGSVYGAIRITVPSGSKYLHLHVAGWKGESVTLNVTPIGYSDNISLTSNTGISSNSPYTFSGDPSTTDYYKVITFSTPLASNTNLTFTASGGMRFVVWGVTAEAAPSKPSPGLAFATPSYNVLPEASFDTPALTNPNGLTVTYSSSDEDIALVDEDNGDIVIGTKEGTATITASSVETETYAAGEASYTITVAKGETTVTLNNAALTFNILDGTTQTLTASAAYGLTPLDSPAITWTSSNTSVANVAAGIVTPVAPGSATITASYAGTTVYAASSADCTVTVNKANTTLTLDKTEVSQDLKTSFTFTLTPTLKATKSDASQVDVVSPTITWTSSDETVATVAGGVVTGLKAGSTTITASYAGGTNYNAATNATCTVTFTDTRTAVNMSTFSAAKTTLVIGDEQATSVTNDQVGWTAAYTYSSDNTSVATVNSSGVITAVARGNATITCSLNVNPSDANYRAGLTTSKTIDITVTKPFHTVTFSVNGDVSRTASVEEDQPIPFPTAAATPSAGQIPETFNGKTFVGWCATEYSNASVAPVYVNTASTNMGGSDVTYYAVYATVAEEESDDVSKAVLSQTLQYDTWTYSGSTTDKSSYRLFHTGSYIESASFDLSKLIKVVINGGTFGGGSYNSLTIGDGTNTWKSVTVTTSGGLGDDTYTEGTALTGTKALRITCNSGTASGTGVRIKYVKIYVKGTVTTKSNYSTDNRAAADISYANATVDVKLSSGSTGQALTNPNSLTVSYSSSDETVATVNTSTGVITELLKAGTTTITATFAGNATYKPAAVSYNLNVTEKTPCSLAYATAAVEKLTTDAAFTNTLTNDDLLTVSYSSSATGVATVNASTGEVAIKGAGETTITATFAGNEDYEAGNASYTLTVSKATPTLSFASDIAIGREGEAFAGNALTNPASLTVTYSSSDEMVATVDSSTGTVTIVAAGTTTITASFDGQDNATYVSGSASYTLKVLATPTITVSNQTIAYGATFTVDDTAITGGDITVTSANTSIASVAGLVITPVACGSVTITVSTAENETYKAGSETFTLTITQPVGGTEAYSALVTVFEETFDESTGTAGWSGSAASGTLIYDNDGWTDSKPNGNGGSARYGTGSVLGYAITPALGTAGDLTLTFKSGAWSGDKTTGGLVLSIDAGSGTLGKTTFDLKESEWDTYETTISGATADTKIKFSATKADKNRFFLDEVKVTKAGEPLTAKLNSNGYATFCSEYPLSFSDADNFTAWQITDIDDDNTITFSRVVGTVKGGTGLFLKGDKGVTGTIELQSADSDTELAGNLLVGTLAPTFVTTGQYYGLSGTSFVKVNAGTVNQGKALLPALEVNESVGAKAFTFIFEEDDATSLNSLTPALSKGEGAIYNLAGQRINNSQSTIHNSQLKHGIYIVNGRKVIY